MKYLILINILLLISCGGGGGGGGSPTSSSSSSNVNWNSTVSSSDVSSYETAEYNEQYGLGNINAAEAYALLEQNGKEVAGDGVTIAVVDSGVRTTHQEISANYEATHSDDYVNNDSDPTDDNGHGTHVAGISNGVKDGVGIHGVAYESGIMALKVLNSGGSGSSLDVISAVDQASNNGAKVINLSLGGSSGFQSYKNAFLRAKEDDVLSVAATGNDSNTQPDYPAYYAADSDLSGYVLAVGAVDVNNNLYYVSGTNGSNHCGDAKNYCLVAPGVEVVSSYITSDSSYAEGTGTSMAAPHVAGAAAVIRAAWPHLTAAQTSQILLTSATDLGESGVDDVYGHGLLNLEEAVQAQGQDTLSFGTSVSSSGYSLSSTTITTDPIFGDAFSVNVANSLQDAIYFDDYGRDFKANLDSKIAVNNVRNLDLSNFIFNNVETNNTSLDFSDEYGFNLNLLVSNYKNEQAQNNFGLKYLVTDNSIDPNVNFRNGFSFTQNKSLGSKEVKFGLAFNIDEITKIRQGRDFVNHGFMTQNSYSANPFSSFVNSSAFDNNLNIFDNQRNFNQIFFSEDILKDKFSLNFAYQTSYDSSDLLVDVLQKQNQFVDMGMNYKIKDDLKMFLSVGQMTEFDNNMLNSKAYGAFESLEDVVTNYAKISFAYDLSNKLNLLASYSQGITNIAGNERGIFRDFSEIRSSSMSMALTYDRFIGIGYQEPLRVYDGDTLVNIATSRDLEGNVQRHQERVSLVPTGRQRDYEVFYKVYLKDSANLNFNLVLQTEPGNISNAQNNYLGFMQYNYLW